MNHIDKNLVQGRGQFKIFEEISSLQFVVHFTSPYICKSSVAKLRKRRGLHDNLKKIGEELFNDYSSKAFKAGLTVKKKFQESVDLSLWLRRRSEFFSTNRFLVHRTVLLRHSHLLPRKPLNNSSHFSRKTGDFGVIRRRRSW